MGPASWWKLPYTICPGCFGITSRGVENGFFVTVWDSLALSTVPLTQQRPNYQRTTKSIT
jgi:hypothetical protein